MEVKAPIHVASSNGVDFLNTLNELLKSQDLSLNIANSEGKLRVSILVIHQQKWKKYWLQMELLVWRDYLFHWFLFLGHTALHCAILAHGRPQRNGNGYVNSLPIIEALIKAGADPNSQVSRTCTGYLQCWLKIEFKELKGIWIQGML